MAHQGVAFRLVIDERVVLDVPASEAMTDRLYDLLGGQAESMLELTAPEVDASAPGEETWSGWISTPDITRGKGDDIHILINDRPVASGPFLQAIRRGYRTRLMQGRHPLQCFLFIFHQVRLTSMFTPQKGRCGFDIHGGCWSDWNAPLLTPSNLCQLNQMLLEAFRDCKA